MIKRSMWTKKWLFMPAQFDWAGLASTILFETKQIILLLAGTLIVAFAYVLFQVPYNLAAGGVSGLVIIITNYVELSQGTLYFLMNIPLLLLGFFYLGRWTFLRRTLIAVFTFSTAVDLLLLYLPEAMEQFPVTDNVLLAAIYAGIVGGIGGGLIYWAGATMGGTGILGRIIQIKTGFPLSQSYLFTDGLIILSAGIVFGWEIALYAFLTLLLNGMASDYVLEGTSRARTATILTEQPETMIKALTDRFHRGVTHWEVVGGYSGKKRTLIMCTIYRPQMIELKRLISDVDPDAFVSIDVTQQVLGSGFTPLKQNTR